MVDMEPNYRRRRVTVLALILIACLSTLIYTSTAKTSEPTPEIDPAEVIELEGDDSEFNYLGEEVDDQPLAIVELGKLAVREWASHSGYSRSEFLNSGSWNKWGNGCNVREKILMRDLDEIIYDDNGCTVMSGILIDPYTAKTIHFTRGSGTSGAVQIDHVVALSNAWHTGAQQLDRSTRNALANDDLNLLAVDGPANSQKSDNDASQWLPPNIGFRCEYVARQIAIKIKYSLWITSTEKTAIQDTLATCPDQTMPAQ
jgi:hypothetical protein